jgi:hypothetical protein
MTTEPDWIRDVLSPSRFTPYLAAAGGEVGPAVQLYWWNIAVSAAFYAPLHCLEMALRNALHRGLTARYRRTDWWAVVPLRGNGLRMVGDARSKLSSRLQTSCADDMVAELSFGFWVSLVSSAYDRSLWVPCLHKAFSFYRGPRGMLHGDLRTMQLFRNRIMHHEPIHHRHLEADHETAIRLLGFLSPSMVQQLKPYDEVGTVLNQRPARPSSVFRENTS